MNLLNSSSSDDSSSDASSDDRYSISIFSSSDDSSDEELIRGLSQMEEEDDDGRNEGEEEENDEEEPNEGSPLASAAAFRASVSNFFVSETKKREAKKSKKMRKYEALEQKYWDNNYLYNPTGQMDVADILQVILLFLPVHARTLLSACQVCWAWSERACCLPQWSLLSISATRSTRLPPLHLIDLLGSKLTILKTNIPVTTRETYQRAKYRRILLEKEKAEESSRLRRQHIVRSGVLRVVGIIFACALFFLALLSAYGVGVNRSSSSFSTQVKVGSAAFFFMAMVFIAFAVFADSCLTKKCFRPWRRSRAFNGARRATCTVFIAALAVCLPLGTCIALITMRVETLRIQNEISVFNTSCPPSLEHGTPEYPYYVVFPRNALTAWEVVQVYEPFGFRSRDNFTLTMPMGVPVQYLRPKWPEAEAVMCPTARSFYDVTFSGGLFSLSNSGQLPSRGVGLVMSSNNATWWDNFVYTELHRPQPTTAPSSPPEGGTAGSASDEMGVDDEIWFPTVHQAAFASYYPSILPNEPWPTTALLQLWYSMMLNSPDPAMPMFGIDRAPVGGEFEPLQEKWDRTRTVFYMVAASIFGVSLLAFLTCSQKGSEKCLVFWCVVACLSLNVIHFVIFGGLCHWGNHDYCLMSKKSASSMFWSSLSFVVTLILYWAYDNIDC